MKNWRVLILSFILYVNNVVLSAPQVVDKVAAVVNNDVVLKSEVDNMLFTVKQGAQKTNQKLPDDTTLRHQILNRLIMDNIVLQLAQRANITISNKQLNQVISNIAAHNHMSLDQLRNLLVYYGMDYNTYRAQIRKEMIITEVRDSEARRRVNILPQEVESLAQQIVTQTDNGINTSQVANTYAAQKERAYRILFNRKFAEEVQTWMQEQRALAYVKILDGDEQ